MPQNFIRLLPFVFAGILCSIFFPVDSISPGSWPLPPPLYAGGSHQFNPPPGVVDAAADLQGLLTHFITAVWNALHSIYATSTTSNLRDSPHGTRDSTNTIIDHRAKLWAISRAQGWAGLDRVAQGTLFDIGRMMTIQGESMVRQHELTYVRRLITRFLLELFSSSNPHAIFGPALQDDISDSFARSGNSSFSPILNDEVASFIAITISSAASLSTTLIHLIDEDEMIAEAFNRFASNPSLWSAYTQPTPNFLSIEEIVRNAHHSQGRAFHALPIIPNSRESSLFAFLRALPDASNVDLEAATGPFALCDEDIAYIAALFVAVIIRFHRRNDIMA